MSITTKTKEMAYRDVMALPRPAHKKPRKPSRVLSLVMRAASASELKQVHFTYTCKNMERAGRGPWLILMNHSSFTDLSVVSGILFPRRYNIVITADAYIGKPGLMRMLGCIPTNKFVSDISLITDIKYALHHNKMSVLMFPEACYPPDGCTSRMPEKMGELFRLLKVPVVVIKTEGSFIRDPLYNEQKKRKATVSATIECLLTPEEIETTPTDVMDQMLRDAIQIDNFALQQAHGVKVTEDFRADGLHRVLYRCPHCQTEGQTVGKGITLTCHGCGKSWELTEDGYMQAIAGETEFAHIPDWYNWERSVVNAEVDNGTYVLDTDVEIYMGVDYKAMYHVGAGHLHHDQNGFTLDGDDGDLHVTQSPLHSFTLNADYYFYCMGDLIAIGKRGEIYYCFPKDKDVVSRARFAAETLYDRAKVEKTAQLNRRREKIRGESR